MPATRTRWSWKGGPSGSCCQRLGAEYPQLKKHLFDDQGKLRNFVNVYVNDDDIRHLDKELTRVSAKDVISIIPSVAGGAAWRRTAAARRRLAAPRGARRRRNGALTQQQIQRYSRHLIMPEVAMEGQQKLRHARVLVIGAGGLGSPVLSYLAAAGVGTLGIVDFDTVDFTNLQRQIIYSTGGRWAGPSWRPRRSGSGRMNPDVQVQVHEARLTSENALAILRGLRPGGRRDGQLPHPLPGQRCLRHAGHPQRLREHLPVRRPGIGVLPEGRALLPLRVPRAAAPGLVPSCAEGGVLGVLPGIIGTIQATEAIKLILGKGTSLAGRLLVLDAMKMRFRELKLRKDPDCPVCGEHPTVTELIDYEQFCGIRGEEMEAKDLGSEWEISPPRPQGEALARERSW